MMHRTKKTGRCRPSGGSSGGWAVVVSEWGPVAMGKCQGPDRFRANSGVQCLLFRFVITFVTWRPKPLLWPE